MLTNKAWEIQGKISFGVIVLMAFVAYWLDVEVEAAIIMTFISMISPLLALRLFEAKSKLNRID